MSSSLPARAAGKRAFVTGAAGGLGAASARMLARHGAKVFLTDIDAASVAAVAAEINRENGATVAWSAMQDVRDEASWERTLADAVKAMGGLSVLEKNRAIIIPGRRNRWIALLPRFGSRWLDPLPSHARLQHRMDPRHRPRRHRHANRGRTATRRAKNFAP